MITRQEPGVRITDPVIVGLGTGRCGTRSLARLLDLQQGVYCTHEAKPCLNWALEIDPARHLRISVTGATIVADVAFYYLPWVDHLRRTCENIRFVCLRRDIDETVDSFARQLPRAERWFERGGDPQWSRCFPNISAGPFRDQVRRYWKLYYDYAEHLLADDFRIFETPQLSTYEGAREILSFCGIDNPDPVPVHEGHYVP